MNDNTAFKTDSSNRGEPSIYMGSDGLILRFNQLLPTEYQYKTASFERSYFRSCSKFEKDLLGGLEEAGSDLNGAKKVVEEFDKKCYAIYKEMNTTMELKQKAMLERLEKVCKALDHVTKTQILEYIHSGDEELEKITIETEKIAQELLKNHKAKA